MAFRLLPAEFTTPVEIARSTFSTHRDEAEKKMLWAAAREFENAEAGGLGSKLTHSTFKPPLPSIFLWNAQSIRYKMDEIQLELATQKQINNCCSLIF